MSAFNDDNPWIGLRSYSEGLPLYGRDDEIEVLTSRFIYNVQTVLYGRSGIGKSSIIKAGIFPRLRENDIIPVHIILEHNDIPYTEQIVKALAEELAIHGIEAVEIVPHPVDAEGRSLFDESLWEYFHRHEFKDAEGRPVTPLVVLDQFEEIFTLEKDRRKVESFFVELGDLLNHTKPSMILEHEQRLLEKVKTEKPDEADGGETPARGGRISRLMRGKAHQNAAPEYLEDDRFHIVLSLREDYLSYLERSTSRIPLLKQNRYSLQPINEEQASQIILKPRSGLVDKPTTKLIIEKVTGQTDFELDGVPEITVDAAVLSLYLSRLYAKKKPQDSAITPDLIRQFGDNIIDDFYRECMESYPTPVVEYLEDTLLNAEGHRENISVYTALHSCPELTEDMIRRMSDEQRILRRFSYNDSDRIEFVHDILCPIIRSRREAREQQRIIEEQQRRQREQHDALMARQRKERRRFMNILATVIAVAIVIAGVWLYRSWMNTWEYSECYADFVRRGGWPVGVGEPLTDKQKSHAKVYYRLSRKGRSDSRPFNTVTVESSTGIVQPGLRSPIVATDGNGDPASEAFTALNSRARTIRFIGETASANSPVSRETYYDSDGKLLYAINYVPAAEGLGSASGRSDILWAMYVDSKGLPMELRGNHVDRMRVFLSTDSLHPELDNLETKYMFYDAEGNPVSNDLGCYGFRVSYGRGLEIDTLVHLDRFSAETLVEARHREGDNVLVRKFFSPDGVAVNHPVLGYSGLKETTDDQGNVIVREYSGPDGKPRKEGVASSRYYYDKMCRLDSVSHLDASSRQTGWRTINYADNNTLNILDDETFSTLRGAGKRLDKRLSYRRDGLVADTIKFDRETDSFEHVRTTRSADGKSIHTLWLDPEGRPAHSPMYDDVFEMTETRAAAPGGRRTVVMRYFDDKKRLCENSAIDSIVYDGDGMVLKSFTFNADGSVVKAMGFDYLDGVEVARYALSLDGSTPIRCRLWEQDNLTYYKLKNVRNNNKGGFDLAYVEAESEYPGCRSLVVPPDEKLTVSIDTMNMGAGWKRLLTKEVDFPSAPATVHHVDYLHITDLGGDAYLAGLRDGDIVLSRAGNNLTVARYDRRADRWQRIGYTLSGRRPGYEVYPVAYSKEEYDFYTNGVRNL